MKSEFFLQKFFIVFDYLYFSFIFFFIFSISGTKNKLKLRDIRKWKRENIWWYYWHILTTRNVDKKRIFEDFFFVQLVSAHMGRRLKQKIDVSHLMARHLVTTDSSSGHSNESNEPRHMILAAIQLALSTWRFSEGFEKTLLAVNVLKT